MTDMWHTDRTAMAYGPGLNVWESRLRSSFSVNCKKQQKQKSIGKYLQKARYDNIRMRYQ